MNNIFERLCRRTGGYSLPFLCTISNQDTTLRFINDTQGLTYGGNTYSASTFKYIPDPQENGLSGGGVLNISAADANKANGIIALIQNATEISLDIIGVMRDDGTIDEIKTFHHDQGSAKLNGRTLSFRFERDDRLGMSFPALIFSHYNNRGN